MTFIQTSAGFNPRTRTGCDWQVDYAMIMHYQVSIHAPARGATQMRPPGPAGHLSFNPRTRTGCDSLPPYVGQPHTCFNPRTRTGCDQMVLIILPTCLAFQSTHPHGVRLPGGEGDGHGRISFNPRTRTGCDSSCTR